ncbi:MAG: hypothetical protein RIQ46_107, partial [Pseudomonadota bacterium]
RDHDWFGDWRIVVLAIMAFLGFCVFVIWELTEKHPVVDLRILRHRGFAASLAVLALAFGSFFASIVILPQWLQIAQGYTATDAGMIMAIQSAASLAAAPVAARLMQKVDPRILLTSGLSWMAMTTLVRSTWFNGMDFYSMAWPMALQGLGVPFMMIPLTVVTLSSVRPQETASAAGLQNFMRTMAIAIATATVLTIWGDSQRVARNEMVTAMRPESGQAAMSAAGLSPEQARGFLSMMVDQEAYVMAMNHTFFMTALLLLLSAAIVWIVPPVKPGQELPMGH